MYKFVALFLTGLVPLLNGCQSSEVGRPMPITGEIVATVNGVEIRDTEVNMNTMARQQMRQQVSPEESLKQLVNVELLRQAAVKQGLHKDPKVIEQTSRLAVEVNHHSTNILIQAYIEKLEESNSSNSEALQSAYDDYISTMPSKEYKARHILSATREEAVANIKALKAGKNFAKLAQEKSLDKGSPEGDLGWAGPDNYVPEFAAALRTIETGKYSQEPVQTQFGWHVILVEDVREAKVPGMDEMRTHLQQVTRAKLVEKNLEDLRNAAAIDIKNGDSADATSENAAPSVPAS